MRSQSLSSRADSGCCPGTTWTWMWTLLRRRCLSLSLFFFFCLESDMTSSHLPRSYFPGLVNLSRYLPTYLRYVNAFIVPFFCLSICLPVFLPACCPPACLPSTCLFPYQSSSRCLLATLLSSLVSRMRIKFHDTHTQHQQQTHARNDEESNKSRKFEQFRR